MTANPATDIDNLINDLAVKASAEAVSDMGLVLSTASTDLDRTSS